jgi:hypothetical protein
MGPGTLHNFLYKAVISTFVCEDCGMTAEEILAEDIEAQREKREPIYIALHNQVKV